MNEVRNGIESISPYFYKARRDYIEVYVPFKNILCPYCGEGPKREMRAHIDTRNNVYEIHCRTCKNYIRGKSLGEAVDKLVDLIAAYKKDHPEIYEDNGIKPKDIA